MRADMVLLEKGLVKSRQKAKELIEQGAVTADGVMLKKASQSLAPSAKIIIDSPLKNWVSRGALKLQGAIERFPDLVFVDKVAIDIGASTGGFTQVLLSKGIGHVYALDVGHGQLAPSLVASPRVTNLEKQNARYITKDMFSPPFDVIVTDVSFISLKLALPPALAMAPKGAQLVALIKPQFEVGRAGLDKGGIVKDAALREEVITDIRAFIADQGWHIYGVTDSPITGPDGNHEYLLAAQKQ